MPYLQQNMTYASGQQPYQQATLGTGYGYSDPGVPLSSSYTYAASYGLPAATPMQPTGQQPATSPDPVTVVNSPHTSSDWQEFEARNGRRYYYRKITKRSCWEKPLKLMTISESAKPVVNIAADTTTAFVAGSVGLSDAMESANVEFKMHSKHYWSLQMWSSTGTGNRLCE
ncbi:hypothetical protein ACET3Z_017329 [Daucus carota]